MSRNSVYKNTNQNPNYDNNMQFNNQNNNRKSVSNNQVVQNVIVVNDMTNFKTNPIIATCPSCRTNGLTNVDLIFSWANYACYMYTTPLIWIIYQSCRGKDISCNNSKHYCTGCGTILAYYNAC